MVCTNTRLPVAQGYTCNGSLSYETAKSICLNYSQATQGAKVITALGDSLVSISPTFYEQLLRQNPFAKKIQTQILST